MDRVEALGRLRAARVGRIATVRRDGSPHVVPFVFAPAEREGGLTLFWVVDDKPKRSRRIQRLANLEADPRTEIVVDRYDDDWRELWWVRASGRGRVVDDEGERAAARVALAERYPAYASLDVDAVIVAVDVERIAGWQASEPT